MQKTTDKYFEFSVINDFSLSLRFSFDRMKLPKVLRDKCHRLWSSFFMFYLNLIRQIFLYRFPNDSTALSIDKQFLWGSSLLISPILYEVSSKKVIWICRSTIKNKREKMPKWESKMISPIKTECHGQKRNEKFHKKLIHVKHNYKAIVIMNILYVS